MVLALPEAETIRYTPQATFDNIHGQRVDTAQALEAMARTYMDGEYTTGGDRKEGGDSNAPSHNQVAASPRGYDRRRRVESDLQR
jgi:hypothetical protein